MKIGPYVVLALDFGTTKAFGLGLVWPDFDRNDARSSSINRP